MFSYFSKPSHSEELNSLIRSAAQLATDYSHDYVGVEHVVLCMRVLPVASDVWQILNRLSIDLPAFWQTLEKEARVTINRPTPTTLPLTPRLKKVLKIAVALAKAEKQKKVSIVHFLVSVSAEGNSLVAFILRSYLVRQAPHYTNFDSVAALMIMRLRYPGSMTHEQVKASQGFKSIPDAPPSA